MHILAGQEGDRALSAKTSSKISAFPAGFEEGLEIALAWLDQWSRASKLDRAVESLGLSARHILRSELFAVIMPCGQKRARVWYPPPSQSAPSDPELVTRLCAVKFTHTWQRREADGGDRGVLAGVAVESLLAVPLFRAGRPGGCVAVANKAGGGYTKSDAWVLALAAAILGLGDEG